jgi:hypothetical protein
MTTSKLGGITTEVLCVRSNIIKISATTLNYRDEVYYKITKSHVP